MEYISYSLRNILKEKPICFGRNKFEKMDSIEYFISCQLFKQLIECVQYLHESKPPIMHRNLCPNNILIMDSPNSQRYLKLCSFIYAKSIENDNSYHTVPIGAYGYIAPELCQGFDKKNIYNTKADIYSLGGIAQAIFDYDINEL